MPCGVSATVGYDQTSDITSESINESNTATVDNKQTNDVISEPKNFLPNKQGFKLAFLNITSLIKHLDELRVLLVNSPVDVAINETRLDSNITDNEVHISGYEIVRRDRNINGRYGGAFAFTFAQQLMFYRDTTYLLIKLRICVLKSASQAQSLFSLQHGIDHLTRLLTNSSISRH